MKTTEHKDMEKTDRAGLDPISTKEGTTELMSKATSVIISLRLRPHEYAMLQTLTARGGACGNNPSEFFRTLLHREHNRRVTGNSKVPPSVYSEMRIGRPKQEGDGQ